MKNITHVIKRDKQLVPFDDSKITEAILKAMRSTEECEVDEKVANRVKNRVVKKLKSWDSDKPHVDQIHILVENSLMDARLYDVAREYITYRDLNKPDIFRKRIELYPEEYPYLLDYKDAIRNSYWLHTHFNYDADVQDVKTGMSHEEVTAATRAMLAISQIENAVKTFWARLDMKLPKPEVAKVGATFADSEVRHEDAYKKLLEKLQLKDQFREIRNVPAIEKRIKYLEKVNSNIKATDNRDFFEAIILFSIFVENVSLFSQFIILMSFNKYQNKLKGISNAVEATSKEERIHAEFGFELINIIREENPDWFDLDLEQQVVDMCHEALHAEVDIVNWIYEEGDLDFIPKERVIEYIKYRINLSLTAIGMKPIFDVEQDQIDQLDWFDDELTGTKVVDFFNKRNPQYSIAVQSRTADDLF